MIHYLLLNKHLKNIYIQYQNNEAICLYTKGPLLEYFFLTENSLGNMRTFIAKTMLVLITLFYGLDYI